MTRLLVTSNVSSHAYHGPHFYMKIIVTMTSTDFVTFFCSFLETKQESSSRQAGGAVAGNISVL